MRLTSYNLFLGEDGHYKPFDELYGSETTEEHRPSLKKTVQSGGHLTPFSPSGQTAKTVKCVFVCAECDKPRVVYAANKLSREETENLERIKNLFSILVGQVYKN
jgi:hypothetical protein